jgi:hypothetical protein
VGLYRKTNKTGTYLVVIADGDRGHKDLSLFQEERLFFIIVFFIIEIVIVRQTFDN